MFGGAGISSFSSPPGSGMGFGSPAPHSMTAMGSAIVSPNASGLGGGMMSSGGSPIFQSPSTNKFPTGGGAIVFTPHQNPSTTGGASAANPVSPYSYVGGSASSFVQSPPPSIGAERGAAIVYSPPPYSSTMIGGGMPHHPVGGIAASPITHGYGHAPPGQYANAPYGYGGRAMTSSATHGYYHSPYQHHYPGSPYYGHHSPRDEIVEPMHCSPVGQPHTVGSPQYQQHHIRSPPGNQPPRPQQLPAYLTGVDVSAVVTSRPRRVFDRSPSTSPPIQGTSGGRSPSSKSPTWGQQDGVSASGAGYSSHGAVDSTNAAGGIFRKRLQGQGPNKHLRFNESQNVQIAAEEKEKAKRSGPPVHGFGASEEISGFLSSPLLNESQEIVPGAAISREAVLKYGSSPPLAESNWVTVFGFPAAAASFIYTNFAQYGSILQSKCNPGGNWLHIQYANRIDARKALACNGRVLGGSIMVGVISSPREVIEMYEKSQEQPGASNTSTQSSSTKSPLQERNLGSSVNTEGSSDASSKLRNIRPLAGSSQLTSPIIGISSGSKDKPSFISPSASQNENMPLPTSSSGILTKAMEYMFGW